ncbi:DUF397 domain-containing protein [Pseudofrankia sp. DC12]|uniref:DUF397 domain-containing protein n=1 Tax=Pseudofrankia sp. DC12 TaxID=683315 RepID=UPI000695CC83|nr:DUF397 domain-containing protein [Pseudofrankia sp. DC12]
MDERHEYSAAQRRKPDLSGVSAGDLDWFHSAESNGAGGMCVEIAPIPGGGFAMRDSMDPDRLLAFSAGELDSHIRAAKGGELDRFLIAAERATS